MTTTWSLFRALSKKKSEKKPSNARVYKRCFVKEKRSRLAINSARKCLVLNPAEDVIKHPLNRVISTFEPRSCSSQT